MGYVSVYRCDRDLCTAEEPPSDVLGEPVTWVGIYRREGAVKLSFCSWVCADIEVGKRAGKELDAKADAIKGKVTR